MVFLIIVAAVFVLVVDYIISKDFYSVALAKGYGAKKYFWYCFLLGGVGYLLVLALPNRMSSYSEVGNALPNL